MPFLRLVQPHLYVDSAAQRCEATCLKPHSRQRCRDHSPGPTHSPALPGSPRGTCCPPSEGTPCVLSAGSVGTAAGQSSAGAWGHRSNLPVSHATSLCPKASGFRPPRPSTPHATSPEETNVNTAAPQHQLLAEPREAHGWTQHLQGRRLEDETTQRKPDTGLASDAPARCPVELLGPHKPGVAPSHHRWANAASGLPRGPVSQALQAASEAGEGTRGSGDPTACRPPSPALPLHLH